MTIAYWFAAKPELPNDDGRPVVIGETLTVEPPIKCCVRGLHGSIEPFDALQYAPGNLLYKNRHSGEMDFQSDKLCSTERTALAVIDASQLLGLFARRLALGVIHLWDAAPIVRKFLETGDESFRHAAGDAARAAAGDASWDASGCAAGPAAGPAARVAAWAAARVAAREAARVAARASDACGWDGAQAMFKEMVEEAFRP